MLYLSQILKKGVVFEGQKYGKVVDLALNGDRKSPEITKIIVKRKSDKVAIPISEAAFENNLWHLKSSDVKTFPLDENDFYLNEDLLDKQVIDVDGRRLVRVNDVVLKENGALKIEGIDIGFSGVLRRLGITSFKRALALPWSVIEAFDYQTGNVQLKLTQSKLNSFHPAEIADILEEAGAKERLGLVKALETERAAAAISEADEETQSAILEEVPHAHLKRILEKMKSSEIADVFDKLNPFTTNKILSVLEGEKAKRVKKLLVYEDDEAGGLMELSFTKVTDDKKVSDILSYLRKEEDIPEAVVVVDKTNKLRGVVHTKNLMLENLSKPVKELLRNPVSVEEEAPFPEILEMFAEYNLRILPVVDKEGTVVGVISIDRVLSDIQEEEEKEDAI